LRRALALLIKEEHFDAGGGSIIMSGQNEKTGWEHFPHQADIGVRGRGPSRERAFEQAAVALTAVITDPDKVEPEQKVEIKCSAPDDELLLVDWLNCLLCEMGTRKMLFGRFEVRIEGNELEAGAWGEKMDVSKHCPVVEVKAATYTELSVREDENGTWTAQCVVDV
jgi:tRNA nucleotidyltransferase (CCA-adding enzyme)